MLYGHNDLHVIVNRGIIEETIKFIGSTRRFGKHYSKILIGNNCNHCWNWHLHPYTASCFFSRLHSRFVNIVKSLLVNARGSRDKVQWSFSHCPKQNKADVRLFYIDRKNLYNVEIDFQRKPITDQWSRTTAITFLWIYSSRFSPCTMDDTLKRSGNLTSELLTVIPCGPSFLVSSCRNLKLIT